MKRGPVFSRGESVMTDLQIMAETPKVSGLKMSKVQFSLALGYFSTITYFIKGESQQYGFVVHTEAASVDQAKERLIKAATSHFEKKGLIY